MRRRTLGRTGLEVSELALGGLFVSRFGGGGDDAEARGCAAIRRALELGVNYIDTAPTYSDSEAVLGRALAGVDARIVLSTKLGGRPQPFDPKDSGHLRRSLEESLALLGRDLIDILFIHEPDRPGHYDWWTDRGATFRGPVLDFLADVKREGLVRFIGVGGTTAYEMARLVRTGLFDVVLTAFQYSLLWREAETALLPAAREAGVGVVIGSPLQQGALARRYDEAVFGDAAPWLSPPRRAQFQALYRLSDETGLSLPEMALRFVLSNPDVSCVLTGARSETEVEENVASGGRGPLPPDLLKRLDEIAALVPFRPADEPACPPLGNPNYKGPGRI